VSRLSKRPRSAESEEDEKMSQSDFVERSTGAEGGRGPQIISRQTRKRQTSQSSTIGSPQRGFSLVGAIREGRRVAQGGRENHEGSAAVPSGLAALRVDGLPLLIGLRLGGRGTCRGGHRGLKEDHP